MRRKYDESWPTDGSIFDAIAAMKDRITTLVPRKPRFLECEVMAHMERHDGVQDSWIVTLAYEAEDET